MLLVLKDIEEIREHPVQNQFWVRTLKMVLSQFSDFARNDGSQPARTLLGRQDSAFVEWIKQKSAMSHDEVPWEIDSFNDTVSSSGDHHVYQRKRNWDSEPGVYHAWQKRVPRIVIVAFITMQAKFLTDKLGHCDDTRLVRIAAAESLSQFPAPRIDLALIRFQFQAGQENLGNIPARIFKVS
jgi:hypothetical protein